MKTFNFLFLTLAIVVFASSCEKETSNVESETISEEEAVDVVTGALMADSEGVTSEASEAAKVADTYDEGVENAAVCGQTYDSTFVKSYNGTNLSAAYSSAVSWTINCNDFNIPVSLDWGWTTQGDYESLRLLSNDNASSSWNVGNLITGSMYLISGSYTRSGNQESKVRNMNSFTSEVDINLTNLEVSKETYEIESGEGTFVLTGETSTGATFSFEGSIVFLGNQMATLTINGTTYDIDLN